MKCQPTVKYFLAVFKSLCVQSFVGCLQVITRICIHFHWIQSNYHTYTTKTTTPSIEVQHLIISQKEIGSAWSKSQNIGFQIRTSCYITRVLTIACQHIFTYIMKILKHSQIEILIWDIQIGDLGSDFFQY
jgi:hypothetical protein